MGGGLSAYSGVLWFSLCCQEEEEEEQNERMKGEEDVGVRQEAPLGHLSPRAACFPSPFFIRSFAETDGEERVLKIPPSFLPVSISSPVVAIATEPHLHTELIQLGGVCCSCLSACVSLCVLFRLFNTRDVSKVVFGGSWKERRLVWL